MKFRWWIFYCFIGLLLLFAARSDAQSTDSCNQVGGSWYKYGIGATYNGGTASGNTYANPTSACVAAEAVYCPTHAGSAGCLQGHQGWTGIDNGSTIACDVPNWGPHLSAITRSAAISNPAVNCPAITPEACTPIPGQPGTRITAGDWRSISASPVDFCSQATGCKVKMSHAVEADGTSVWTMLHTAEDCNAETEIPEAEDLSNEGESCVMVGSAEYCATPAGSGNCGFLNDSYICLNTVPEMGCKDLGASGMVCDADADTPPVPDNGTPGVPATPAGDFSAARPTSPTATTTNNYNYYTETQVNTSNRSTGDGTPSTGGGTNHGPVGGSGSGDGEGEEEEPPCQGEDCAASLPSLDEAPTILVTTQDYWTRLNNAPIIEAALSIGESIPDAGCPTWNLSIFGTTIPFSAGCEFMPDIAPILELAFFAGWCLLGFRILFSA